MMLSDSEIKSVEGKPYNPKTSRKLVYGGRVNSKGIIVKAYTNAEFKKSMPKCPRHSMEILAK